MPLSGQQYEVTAGGYTAVAVGGGGGVRSLTWSGRDLLDGYDADDLPDGARGQVLAPWPNRLRDGRWSYGGVPQQLPLDDLRESHAIHGLVRWSTWHPEQHVAHRVVLRHRLQARPGYPFSLELRVAYEVHEEDGLTVELSAQNVGTSPAPVALGMHPYVAAPGGGVVDDCHLRVPGRTRLLVDERRLPRGTERVEGTAHDLRSGRRIADLVLDDAYTDLHADADGKVRVLLRAADGTAVELWTDRTTGWLQVFSGDTLAPDRRRRSVAIEPLTAPADALRTGTGLVLLQPGASHRLRWGVRAAPGDQER